MSEEWESQLATLSCKLQQAGQHLQSLLGPVQQARELLSTNACSKAPGALGPVFLEAGEKLMGTYALFSQSVAPQACNALQELAQFLDTYIALDFQSFISHLQELRQQVPRHLQQVCSVRDGYEQYCANLDVAAANAEGSLQKLQYEVDLQSRRIAEQQRKAEDSPECGMAAGGTIGCGLFILLLILSGGAAIAFLPCIGVGCGYAGGKAKALVHEHQAAKLLQQKDAAVVLHNNMCTTLPAAIKSMQESMRLLAFFFDSMLTELSRVQNRGNAIDKAAASSVSAQAIQTLYMGMRRHMMGIKNASNDWLQAAQSLSQHMPAGPA